MGASLSFSLVSVNLCVWLYTFLTSLPTLQQQVQFLRNRKVTTGLLTLLPVLMVLTMSAALAVGAWDHEVRTVRWTVLACVAVGTALAGSVVVLAASDVALLLHEEAVRLAGAKPRRVRC